MRVLRVMLCRALIALPLVFAVMAAVATAQTTPQTTIDGSQPRKASYPSLSVPIVAGKVAGEVQAVLGLPASCGQYHNWPRCSFREGTIRITFINQRADWIEYRPQIDVPLAPEALRVIGLPVSKPTKSQPTTLSWSEIPGYLDVTLSAATPNSGPIFQIKWRTP